MEGDRKHWVEALFSPHFTVEDFFKQTFEPEELITEKLTKERAKTVEKIYHDAFERFQEADKLKRKDLLSKMIVNSYEPNVHENKQKKQSPVRDHYASINLTHADGKEKPCIWTEGDLKILRSEMDKTQCEGANIKIKFDASKLELSELKTKYKKTEQEFNTVKEALAVSKRQCKSKAILVKQIELDMQLKDSEIVSLKKNLHEKCMIEKSLCKNLSIARKEIKDLLWKVKDLEQVLKTVKQEQEIKKSMSFENLKLSYNLEKNKLLREIETLKEELKKEKIQHDRDHAALNFLRKHFSSISVNTGPEMIQLKILH
ncbi:hypothetical protein GDO86_015413 [Hymenochirus boettgeri]|uniref:Coiled-coil domain-containing protein 160 n=1 Tax=Hymenochirus boettgeri TaxID=247094 RepID=A0A8T2K0X8_9PIPI|nr:hypothetical protein GDO86_015413 [Hymenochirus boettgeri]